MLYPYPEVGDEFVFLLLILDEGMFFGRLFRHTEIGMDVLNPLETGFCPGSNLGRDVLNQGGFLS